MRMRRLCSNYAGTFKVMETVEVHSMVLALQEHDDRGVRQLAAQGAQLFE